MGTLLDKALQAITGNGLKKASRGSISDYVLGAPHQYGQPLPEVASVDAQGLITFERMREIVMKVGTPAACLNATLDYSTNVQINIRNVDPTIPADPSAVAFVEKFMRRPNPNDNGLEFRQKILRDLWTFGMAAVELERGVHGHLANLNVLDMARLRIDYDEHGTILGYNMRDIRGIPISDGNNSPYAWSPDEVMLFKLNPISSSLYGTSRITQLFAYAVIEDLMHHYIGQRFTDSNVPHGVMDLGDITEDELKRAIAVWNSQAQSSHKIMLTGSKGASKWYPFAYNLKDLQAPELVAEIKVKILGIVGVTDNEISGATTGTKSDGYNLSFTFKKRAIEPLLNAFIEKLTTRLLWDELGLEDLEFYYNEIDSRDELIAAQIDETYQKMGVLTLNQVRNRRGDPSVDGGDESMVWTGSSWIPTDLVRPYAEAELQAIQIANQMMLNPPTAVGPDGQPQAPQQSGLKVEMPPQKPLQPGIRNKNPIGGALDSPRIKFQTPKPKSNQSTRDLGQQPRGNVQTLRNVGARQDH